MSLYDSLSPSHGPPEEGVEFEGAGPVGQYLHAIASVGNRPEGPGESNRPPMTEGFVFSKNPCTQATWLICKFRIHLF